MAHKILACPSCGKTLFRIPLEGCPRCKTFAEPYFMNPIQVTAIREKYAALVEPNTLDPTYNQTAFEKDSKDLFG